MNNNVLSILSNKRETPNHFSPQLRQTNRAYVQYFSSKLGLELPDLFKPTSFSHSKVDNPIFFVQKKKEKKNLDVTQHDKFLLECYCYVCSFESIRATDILNCVFLSLKLPSPRRHMLRDFSTKCFFVLCI